MKKYQNRTVQRVISSLKKKRIENPKYVDEAKRIFTNVIALNEGQIIEIPIISKEERGKD